MNTKKRHDEIWPELQALLSESGISDYSIYFDEETLSLFAIQKVTDHFDELLLPTNPIVKKWWAYMSDIMETNSDNSPIATPLKEVFHLS